MPNQSPTPISNFASKRNSVNLAPDTPFASNGDEAGQDPLLVGRSAVMKKLFALIERLAPSEGSVLITGATGTGKELVARTIHEKSPRRNSSFLDINCSAIPETLIEAELFGHQRGSFTGALANTCGLFEKASGGTIFLDEIDALNLSAQAKLLRVLQERTVRRIGARTNIAVDVRVISATNCDLASEVAAGRFRPDLYYRLRVLPVSVPELCKREGDVELLVAYFLHRHAKVHHVAPLRVSPAAMRALVEYPWPGNVRELENAIAYCLAICTSAEIGVEDLPAEVQPAIHPDHSPDLKEVLAAYMSDSIPLAEIERRYILSVLQQFGGNQVKTAAALGIDRSKLYRRLKQYGVMAVRFFQEEPNGMQLRSWSANPTQDFNKS